MTPADNLRKVWFDAGINVDYHHKQQALLLQNWPLLYMAIHQIIEGD